MKKLLVLILFAAIQMYSQTENTLKFKVYDLEGSIIKNAEVYVNGLKLTNSDTNGVVVFNYGNDSKSYEFEIKHNTENLKKCFTLNTKNGKNDFPGDRIVFNQIITYIRLENHNYDLKTIFDNLVRCGTTDLFVETFYHGRTIYLSRVKGIGEHGSGDYLQMVIDEASKRGIRIHAWINTLYWYNKKLKIKNYIPDGALMLNRKGKPDSGDESDYLFVSPNHPEVTRILTELCNELSTRYPQLYGISLDYIRFKSGQMNKNNFTELDYGYEKITAELFQQTTGINPFDIKFDTIETSNWRKWIEYKENLLTNLVVKISSSIRLKREKLCLTVSVFPDYIENRGTNAKCQYYIDFMEFGKLDYILLMCYGNYKQEIGIAYRFQEFGNPVIALSGESKHDDLEKQFEVLKQYELENNLGIWYYSDLLKDENRKFLHQLMFNGRIKFTVNKH